MQGDVREGQVMGNVEKNKTKQKKKKAWKSKRKKKKMEAERKTKAFKEFTPGRRGWRARSPGRGEHTHT